MDVDLESMTVVELKKELKSRSLKVGGKKAELILRLKQAIQTQTIEETTHTNDNDSSSNSNHNQHSDFADFEEYINDEYNRLNNKNDDNNTNNLPNESVNIDDLLNHKEDEEKHIILTDNPTPKQPSTIANPSQISSDFTLNNPSKIEDRRNRFGTQTTNETTKIESRKRRFESTTNTADTPSPKKQRIDFEAERNKILKRAKKYGTVLPKGFKLTEEESAMIYADKISRAKRFGTQHLLPVSMKKAEENAKKSERMKRFNNDGVDGEVESGKVKDIIVGDDEDGGSTKLMERKLRFGTLNDGDKVVKREERFGGKKKKFNNRQVRNNEKFKQFRAYKKNNRRGRGGFGNRRGRGRSGYRGNYNYNNNNNGYEKVEFSVEDNAKINQRKLRFNSM